jgi:hypothetical protein
MVEIEDWRLLLLLYVGGVVVADAMLCRCGPVSWQKTKLQGREEQRRQETQARSGAAVKIRKPLQASQCGGQSTE